MADFADAMPNPAQAALARVVGDSRLVCSTFDSAVRMASNQVPVYMYNYDIPVPSLVVPAGVYLGASHGSELTSVFGTSPLFTPQERAVSDLIQRYWTNFARTGDPNSPSSQGDLTWPAFTASQDVAVDNVRVNFSLQPSVVTNFRAAECAFWTAGYALQF